MSRSTQYIGLTDKAREFVKCLAPVKDSVSCTLGMFEEEVLLGEWEYESGFICEVVQAEPWWGGPMIFTTLVFCEEKAENEMEDAVVLKKHNKEKININGIDWKQDRSAIEHGGIDQEKGLFWI